MRAIGARGLDLLQRWEGCVLHVYLDVAGVPTIGWGHALGPGEAYPHGLTQAEADALLRRDLARFELAVEHAITVPLGEHQYDALVVWAYNVGTGAAVTSTLVRRLNAGEYGAVPTELLRWCRAGGRENAGLRARRQSEGELWSRPDDAPAAAAEPAPLDERERAALLAQVAVVARGEIDELEAGAPGGPTGEPPDAA